MSVFLGGKYLNLYAYLLKRRNHIPINPKLAPNKSTQKPRSEPESIRNHSTAESKQTQVNVRLSSAANILARVGGGGGQAEVTKALSPTTSSHTPVTSPTAPSAASTTSATTILPSASVAAPTASGPGQPVAPTDVPESPVPALAVSEVATAGVAKFTIPTITVDTTTESNPPSMNTVDHIVNTVEKTTLHDTTVEGKEDVDVAAAIKGKAICTHHTILYYIIVYCLVTHMCVYICCLYTEKTSAIPAIPSPTPTTTAATATTATVGTKRTLDGDTSGTTNISNRSNKLKKAGAIVVPDTLSTTDSASSIGGRSANKAPTTTDKDVTATTAKTPSFPAASKAVEKPVAASSKVVKSTKAPVWTTTHSSIGTPVVGKYQPHI